MNEIKKHKYTIIVALHYVRLFFRIAIFLLGVFLYWHQNFYLDLPQDILATYPLAKWFLVAIWGVFVLEILFRFIPSDLESPGCQKHFKQNYKKTGSTDIQIHDNHATTLVLLVWICFNMIFGSLNIAGILDDGVMILLSLFYCVCDQICILFFCPFQTLFLKNKCCSDCRIYNWNYAMIMTPLFFVKAWYSWSLLALSLLLMFTWEFLLFKFPERFSEKTNAYLTCANCNEKLCHNKKHLEKLWIHLSDFSKKRIARLLNKD